MHGFFQLAQIMLSPPTTLHSDFGELTVLSANMAEPLLRKLDEVMMFISDLKMASYVLPTYRFISFTFLGIILDIVFCANNRELIWSICPETSNIIHRKLTRSLFCLDNGSSMFKFCLTMFIFCLFVKVWVNVTC